MPPPGPDERVPGGGPSNGGRGGGPQGRRPLGGQPPSGHLQGGPPQGAERVPSSGRILAGRYRLDRVLGKGSMGTVWAAYDEILHRRVAIKEIYVPDGTGGGEAAMLVERTLREARAIAQLSHPNVITLYDILTLASGPVIVMEVLASRSLGEVLKENGPLTVGQAATVGLAVAAGLSAAHAAGITHRDVKPGNVLIGADGRIKLTDFGIARSAAENPMTATGLLLGSPAYIAPEVASGVTAGPPADAWGLGALLFACVEGRPPFDKGSPVATLMSVVSDPIPPLRQAGALAPVIDGLLQKDPVQRWTLRQARAALRPLAADPAETRLVVESVGRADSGDTSDTAGGADTLGRTDGVGRADTGPEHSTGRSVGTGLGAGRVPPPPLGYPPTAAMRPPWLDDAPARNTIGAMGSAFPRDLSASSAWPRDPSTGTALPRDLPAGSEFARDLSAARSAPAPAVPPPPWAASGAAALAPLPAATARRSAIPNAAARWWLAAVVFLTAALIAFFGLRAIADGSAVQGSAVSGGAMSDSAVSDSAVSDSAVSDSAVSGSAVQGSAVPDAQAVFGSDQASSVNL